MQLITRPVLRLLRPVMDYALPPRCPGCGIIVEDDDRFCLPCWSSMTFLGEPCCDRCGIPFPYDMGADALCGPCLANPPSIDRSRAVLAYGDLARTVALKLKYGRRIGLSRLIAQQMVRHVPLDAGENVLIVPVPLHRWRLWWRGFNQSALIAGQLARATSISVNSELLVRTKRTPPLRNLNPMARKKIVRGAFALSANAKAQLKDRDIILIDDVHTSGATAEACAAALRKGGARSVMLICWARVLPDAPDD
ncbi:ComF family protein [Sphingobium sp. SCG-1]|uniref:ComF family protein n=1 Tax=Sphingobium sp. SCG-1 TaxID=2072936 RepID=UPI000CD69681|nr:ComF family protein [Sphingobium sp. SCG-1]AUW60290.1 ComF family protein [Sphingobium sp. SCG-1]